MGKASTRAHNKYIAKAYDRINLTVPKGKKDTIQANAEAQNESVNGFINRAINNQISQDRCKDLQEAAQNVGETVSQFIERAVSVQAQRDKSSLAMGINPTTGSKLEKEA